MKSVRAITLELIIASFLVLFQELILIRWVASQVRVISYFPNIILLSAFLGLGLGCLRSGKKALTWLWPASLLLLAGAIFLMREVVFTQRTPTEHLWLMYFDLPNTARVIRSIELPIMLSFILCALTFIPLGQLVAERIQAFREWNRPLMGYSFDLAGSLLGVMAFAIGSLWQIRPAYWFASLMLLGGVFFLKRRSGVILYAVLSVVIVGGAAAMDRDDAYSPYYSLRREVMPGIADFVVLTNGSLHQFALNMARGAKNVTELNRGTREWYHAPYNMLEAVPRTALVLGAGTGNDVAALLDQGVAQIDAVEIDPVILKWGAGHPNAPYASPRVKAINTDARSFLNTCTKRYDLIVFGTLDSQTRLSALSSVRLDNFVYTVETMRAVKRLLTPKGGVVMYFMVGSEYIHQRIQAMLTEAFGVLPLMCPADLTLFNMTYMAGPAYAARELPSRTAASSQFIAKVLPTINVPSDDWPYLYLEQRKVDGFYLSLMAAIALLSLVSVLAFSPDFRQSLGLRKSVDVEMFLFGLSFLLLETRSVTAMNLMWGATWITSSVVFGSVLLMALAATLSSTRRPASFGFAMIGLVLSLCSAWLVPVELGLSGGVGIKLLFSLLVVGTPIFFAALCFAALFSTRENADLAFGWNLLGAVCGGLLEFLSMSVGLRNLLLVALASYLTAAFVRWRGQRMSRSGC